MILADAFILILLLVLGVLLVHSILGGITFLQTASLAFPIGAGVYSWILFLASWAGLLLTRVSLLLIYLLLICLLLIHNRWRHKEWLRIRFIHPKPPGDKHWSRYLWIVLGIIIVTSMVLSVIRSYSSWDAAAGWASKGYGIAAEGSIFAAGRWGAWGSAYPLNIPLLISVFKFTTGDLFHGSKLIFPLFFTSLLFGFYDFLLSNNTKASLSIIGTILLASTPLIFQHATQGYANLPLTCYLVLGLIWSIYGLLGSDDRVFLIGGVLLALGSWTRAEAILHVFVIIASVTLVHLITKQGRIKPIPWLLPIVIISGSWFLFGAEGIQHSHLGNAMGGVLPSLTNGEYRLRELYLIPRLLVQRAIDISRWGVLFAATGILIVLGLGKFRPKRDNVQLTILVAALALGAVVGGIFYIRSFTRFADFIPFLNRAFDRAFFPAAVTILLFSLLLHSDQENKKQNQGARDIVIDKGTMK